MTSSVDFLNEVFLSVGRVIGFETAVVSSSDFASVSYRYIGPRAEGMDVTIVVTSRQDGSTVAIDVKSVVSDRARQVLSRLVCEVQEYSTEPGVPGSDLFDGRPILPSSGFFEWEPDVMDLQEVVEMASDMIRYCLAATPELCVIDDN